MEATIETETVDFAAWPEGKQRMHALASYIEHRIAMEMLEDLGNNGAAVAVYTPQTVIHASLFTCLELASGAPEYFIQLAQWFRSVHDDGGCDVDIDSCARDLCLKVERVRTRIQEATDGRVAESEAKENRHAQPV